MRSFTLALLPVAWLTLAGAAPVTPSAQDLAECRVPRDEALEALKTFPIARTKELSPAPERNFATYFVVPQGMMAFGAPATDFRRLEKLKDGQEILSVMSIVSAPYEQIRGTALASRGATDCTAKSEGRDSCLVEVRREGEWLIALAVLRYQSQAGVVCRYSRSLN